MSIIVYYGADIENIIIEIMMIIMSNKRYDLMMMLFRVPGRMMMFRVLPYHQTQETGLGSTSTPSYSYHTQDIHPGV